jgi:hypothetical protein
MLHTVTIFQRDMKSLEQVQADELAAGAFRSHQCE